jgi:hypothetical protein
MFALELGLSILTIVGGVCGGLAIYLTRIASLPGRMICGQRLFVATIFGLGLAIVAAAWIKSQTLPLLGLCAGLLLVMMVCEMPETLAEPATSSQADG